MQITTVRYAALVLAFAFATFIPVPADAELTATEKLIRAEIIRLGGDLEAPRFPELVVFFGDKFSEDHFELLSHLPTVRWFVVDHAPATERAFGLLRECPCLDEIHLNSPQQFDGRGLGRLVLQRNLRTLHIDDAQLSDAGFDELLTLTSLKVLTLTDVDFPVNRLVELGRFTKLQELLITSTRHLSENEIEKLRAALPECDVKASGPAEGEVHNRPSAQRPMRKVASEAKGTFTELLGAVRPVNAKFLADKEGHVTSIDLSEQDAVDDVLLEQFVACRHLIHFHAIYTNIKGPGLQILRESHSLETLDLYGCAVGDEGLAHLKDLRNLRHVNLIGSKITDASIPVLLQWTKLEYLGIADTQISREGAKRLRAGLPECEVDY
jgi:hypothetical protein